MAPDGVAVSELAAARANPSMRMIIDLADFDSAELDPPTGQSGHPYHPNYTSMIETYLAGDYAPMPFSAEAVAARGKICSFFNPRKSIAKHGLGSMDWRLKRTNQSHLSYDFRIMLCLKTGSNLPSRLFLPNVHCIPTQLNWPR